MCRFIKLLHLHEHQLHSIVILYLRKLGFNAETNTSVVDSLKPYGYASSAATHGPSSSCASAEFWAISPSSGASGVDTGRS